MLFIALSMQCREARSTAHSIRFHRTVCRRRTCRRARSALHGQQWRRLIEVSIECAEYPSNLRHPYRHPKARVDIVLRKRRLEVRLPHPCYQRQPRKRLVVVRYIRLHQPCGLRPRRQKIRSRAARRIEHRTKQILVVLTKRIHPTLDAVPRHHGVERDLPTRIVRRPLVRRRYRRILRTRCIVHRVVVIERRQL